MKTAKKVLSIILCIAITIIQSAILSFAGTATATLTGTSEDGIVTVTVGLKDAVNVETCELFISYDSDVLEFIDSSNGNAQGFTMAHGNVAKDSCLSCSAMALDAFSGTATLAVFTLKTKSGVTSGTTILKFSTDSFVDNKSVTGSVTVNLKHEHKDIIVNPTCTTEGYTLHKCTVCNFEYKTDIIPATGHKPKITNQVTATKIKDGYSGDKICTVCGKTIEYGVVIPATGIYGDVDFDNKITAKDARLILRYTAKLDVFSVEQQYLADIDRDCKITAKDARKVLRISAKLEQ